MGELGDLKAGSWDIRGELGVFGTVIGDLRVFGTFIGDLGVFEAFRRAAGVFWGGLAEIWGIKG